MIACDRVARPQWEAVPQDERDALESHVPDGARVTLLARTGPRDLTARLYVGGEVVRVWRDRDAARTVRGVLLGIEA